jgi:hypothetical protein
MVISVFALKLFEDNQIYYVVHHTKVSSCNQPVSPVVAWTYQYANRLFLLFYLLLFPLPPQNEMGYLSNCKSSQLHECF